MAVVILDMGGVLVDLDWQGQVTALLGRNFEPEALHRLWIEEPSITAFERGESDFAAFAAAFRKAFTLQQDVEEIQRRFLDMVVAPVAGCDEALDEMVAAGHRLIMLSNTNPAHHRKLAERHGFFARFERLYLSYQTGVMKPDPQAYRQIIDDLAIAPGQAWFFDDGKRNVEAARQQGISAMRVDSVVEAAAILRAMGGTTRLER